MMTEMKDTAKVTLIKKPIKKQKAPNHRSAVNLYFCTAQQLYYAVRQSAPDYHDKTCQLAKAEKIK